MMKMKIWENEIVDTPIKKRGTTDYHYLISKGVSKKSREKMNIGDIWINGAVCLKCSTFIRSMNLHDFKTCSCGGLSVDGGSWYAKRCSKEGVKYIDVIEQFTNLK